MSWRRQHWYWILGAAYGGILMLWGMFAIGVGHGTMFPLFVSAAPLSVPALRGDSHFFGVAFFVTPVLWALIAFLVQLRHSKRPFLVLIAAHYLALLVILYAFRDGLGGTVDPLWMMCWTVSYLIGQFVIWGAFIHVWSKRYKEGE